MEEVKPAVGDTWYRVDAYRTVSLDEYENVTRGSLKLSVHKLFVVKVTPKGVWLDVFMRSVDTPLTKMHLRGARFVLSDARKKYAHPTKELALASFVARKKRQVALLASQLNDADLALRMAQAELGQKLDEAAPGAAV